MKVIKKLTKGDYFAYQVDDGGCGIVKANSTDEAREKVALSYNRHGDPYTTANNVEVVSIKAIKEDGGYFGDDVIELGWRMEFN